MIQWSDRGSVVCSSFTNIFHLTAPFNGPADGASCIKIGSCLADKSSACVLHIFYLISLLSLPRLQPSLKVRRLAATWTIFLHCEWSSVALTVSINDISVHVLMFSCQVVGLRALPCAFVPGMVCDNFFLQAGSLFSYNMTKGPEFSGCCGLSFHWIQINC